MVNRTFGAFLTSTACAALLLSGCDGGATSGSSSQAAPQPAPTAGDVTPQNTAAMTMDSRVPTTEVARIVFLGDSLTAGYGVEADEAYPSLLERQLNAEGTRVKVINAGVSGDTTAGGLRRIDWVLRQSPQVVVVGLGANDGLRGTDVATSEANLRQIITKSRAAGARVLLLGMLLPPNFGPEYTQRFRDMYPRLAREMDVPLVPFMLQGVGGNRRYNQPDGVHPTAEGHEVIASHLLPFVRAVVTEAGAK